MLVFAKNIKKILEVFAKTRKATVFQKCASKIFWLKFQMRLGKKEKGIERKTEKEREIPEKE